jgi:Ca2+-binding EF-hand superfamily protein
MGTLDLDGVTALMKRLNFRLSKAEIKSTFKNADISKKGYLTFETFENMYSALRFRPEIGELFASIARTDPSFVTFDEFQRFLQGVQKVSFSGMLNSAYLSNLNLPCSDGLAVRTVPGGL